MPMSKVMYWEFSREVEFLEMYEKAEEEQGKS